MATSTVAEPAVAADTVVPAAEGRAFERWGIVAYLATTAVLVVAVLAWLHGAFVYVIDDPAIHLGMADTLVRHGTWGVVGGEFQSASSSPLWTVLVAGGIAVAPAADEWVPLLLNVAAGIGVVFVLGRNQALVVPGRRRWLDGAALIVLVVVALFLPGLALVGMEHTLHMFLVLGAVVAVERHVAGTPVASGNGVERPAVVSRRVRLGCLLLALATLTRFETAFVGAGLAVALALADGGEWERVWRRRRQIVAVVAAVGVPLVAFALWNRAMGGGFLPNSVLAKGQGVGVSHTATGLSPVAIIARLRRDPLLVMVLAFALGYLVMTWGRPARHRIVALALAVAVPLHVALADVGWHERYQAYLIALGLYLALGAITELPRDLHRRALAALVLVALALSVPKAWFLAKTPESTDNVYRHQYQAGLFLARYYDGQPVATDQLGYITWFHDGPLTDFAALGDYEVLQRHPDGRDERAELWQDLTVERGFRVVVTFADIVAFNAPETWVFVGQFCKEGETTNGYDQCFAFWATDPDEVAPLRDHLRDFEPELPARVHLELNDWADWQADAVRGASSPEPST